MIEYERIPCSCGEQARIVENGVGTYIRCPFCDRTTMMCTTKEDAIRKFEEEKNNEP